MTVTNAASNLRDALRSGANIGELQLAALAYLNTDPASAYWHPYGFVKLPLTADPSQRISLHVCRRTFAIRMAGCSRAPSSPGL